jgi:hydroxylamine reductase
MEKSFFCFQCEQTFEGTGCRSDFGQCGKDPESAVLQDLIIHALKGLGQVAHRARKLGARNDEIDSFTTFALFSTLTNVNFDPERLAGIADELADLRDRAVALYESAATAAGVVPEAFSGPAAWAPSESFEGMVDLGRGVGIPGRKAILGEDVLSLQELITYGLKGLAAYAYHAELLGQTDESVYAFVHEALDFLTGTHEVGDYVGMALKVGEVNLKVMEMLDAGNTSTFGHPEPTRVRTTPISGKAILVSGHELPDLKAILDQTAGKGISVYTHGEMLPAHAYPELKKYPHLVGHFGTAWQNQVEEFPTFPGAIVMTTNCIQRPAPTYKARIFTAGPVAWPGVAHLEGSDFGPAIEAALAAEGFAETAADDKALTIGFGRNTVMSVAGTVIDAVKAGAIRHFFLIGGCDGDKPKRNYYTKLAQQVPNDCVILTLACGKYKLHGHDYGEIGGIPRLLDVGQCNDAYSAIKIALALADAFKTDVNSLPLSFVLSWYEQKAVVILLTLLHLGIRNIRLGPTLPAFLSKNVAGVIVENFNLMPITTPEDDLKAMLGA